MNEKNPHPRPPDHLCLSPEDLALATDLYQLTMAAGYHARRTMPRGTFELFVRSLPADRKFLVFAGLEQALASVQALRFHPDQLDYLRSLPQFRRVGEAFFEELAEFRFRGEILAMKEGTVFFPYEPIVQVTGTLLEVQLLETLLLNIVNFQTAVASKAARMRLAAGAGKAGGAALAEFGGRRAHGPQAATWVARAAYLAGFDATSNLLAGQRLGLPVVGTMAHSYVLAFDREEDAFRHYQSLFPDHTIHLVDTYDTLEGVRKAVATGKPFSAVRLDSGDLSALARGAREILDEAGLPEVEIFASGDLDEHRIANFRQAGVPIDAYGIGTRLAAISDAPYLSGVYKLVEVEDGGRRLPKAKASTGKPSRPWRKQVVRQLRDGKLHRDLVLRAEAAGGTQGEALLQPVLAEGEILRSDTLEEAREQCRRQLETLPPELQELAGEGGSFVVEIDLEAAG